MILLLSRWFSRLHSLPNGLLYLFGGFFLYCWLFWQKRFSSTPPRAPQLQPHDISSTCPPIQLGLVRRPKSSQSEDLSLDLPQRAEAAVALTGPSWPGSSGDQAGLVSCFLLLLFPRHPCSSSWRGQRGVPVCSTPTPCCIPRIPRSPVHVALGCTQGFSTVSLLSADYLPLVYLPLGPNMAQGWLIAGMGVNEFGLGYPFVHWQDPS